VFFFALALVSLAGCGEQTTRPGAGKPGSDGLQYIAYAPDGTLKQLNVVYSTSTAVASWGPRQQVSKNQTTMAPTDIAEIRGLFTPALVAAYETENVPGAKPPNSSSLVEHVVDHMPEPGATDTKSAHLVFVGDPNMDESRMLLTRLQALFERVRSSPP
jgi:hypothetical protein